ncbi:MAG: enoyl-CoA hydratase/isomerase family protein [Paludibacteraceae bacterium]|nr:enoyl-CoA hydratase/isomerase family protein [Paludibacteraceae bacterium]
MNSYQYLKVERRDKEVEVLTISAPKSLNALNTALLAELDDYLTTLDVTPLRVLVITGDGDRSFVAGADISEMAHKTETEGLDFGRRGAETFRKLEDLPIPTIAAINGFCLGGGLEIAMACDIRYASSKARFGQPEVGLGIIPGFSGTYRLPKLIGQGMAKELIYTGKTIRSDEALRIGLINAVYEPEQLMTAVLSLAEQISGNAPVAVKYAKECINSNYDMSRQEALALENERFAACFATEDQKNGMAAFLNKQPTVFVGK